MKQLIASMFFSIIIMSGLSAAQPTLQKIDCILQPLELTPKGIGHNSKYRSSKLKNQRYTYPLIRDAHTEASNSLNWSGYAAVTNIAYPRKKAVQYVTGTWQVPTLDPSIVDTYSAIWCGIDGYSNFTVEQIGTEHDFINGSQIDYAWFDLYPQPGYLIGGFPVHPGDHIQGEVRFVGDHQFILTISNLTRRVYTVIPKKYTQLKHAQRSSAEWIVEAPSSNLSILPLAHFGNVPFINCFAKIKGVKGGINNSSWQYDAITMVQTDTTSKAIPTALQLDGFGFSVDWVHE